MSSIKKLLATKVPVFDFKNLVSILIEVSVFLVSKGPRLALYYIVDSII